MTARHYLHCLAVSCQNKYGNEGKDGILIIEVSHFTAKSLEAKRLAKTSSTFNQTPKTVYASNFLYDDNISPPLVETAETTCAVSKTAPYDGKQDNNTSLNSM